MPPLEKCLGSRDGMLRLEMEFFPKLGVPLQGSYGGYRRFWLHLLSPKPYVYGFQHFVFYGVGGQEVEGAL